LDDFIETGAKKLQTLPGLVSLVNKVHISRTTKLLKKKKKKKKKKKNKKKL